MNFQSSVWGENFYAFKVQKPSDSHALFEFQVQVIYQSCFLFNCAYLDWLLTTNITSFHIFIMLYICANFLYYLQYFCSVCSLGPLSYIVFRAVYRGYLPKLKWMAVLGCIFNQELWISDETQTDELSVQIMENFVYLLDIRIFLFVGQFVAVWYIREVVAGITKHIQPVHCRIMIFCPTKKIFQMQWWFSNQRFPGLFWISQTRIICAFQVKVSWPKSFISLKK